MSLLLEALKKAERAKEEAAQRRAKTEPETIAAAAAAQAAAPAEPPQPLPDIRQPLEIVREEAPQAEPALTLAEEKPRPAPATGGTPPRAPQAKAEALAGDRAAARKVFEAKFREPNPRLPFFITMGALGVFMVGTVLYFWMQLRPPAPLVNLNPKPPAGEQVAAAAPTASAPSAPAPAAAKSAIPGLPPIAAAPAPVLKPEPAPRVAETPLLKPAVRPAAPPRNEPAPTEVIASRAAPQVNGKVTTGYAAYLAGDLATARSEYEQALREEPANRDALLGLAALDVRAGRFEAAEGAYQRLLRADPRDAYAHAALIALRGGRFDPAAAESRVKSMLAENPGAHVLNFTLGNQFAQQGRWAEAQQEFFKAFAAEPENADFAYNLAVSLDHLRQSRLALEYYQRALTLAKARGASFDTAAAEARAAQLR
jgi:tetratricopeptide (TPR) repeat protein